MSDRSLTIDELAKAIEHELTEAAEHRLANDLLFVSLVIVLCNTGRLGNDDIENMLSSARRALEAQEGKHPHAGELLAYLSALIRESLPKART